MQIAFYGTARQIGTSANMAAVEAGFMHYYKLPVKSSIFQPGRVVQTKDILLTECRNQIEVGKVIKTCDLLILNVSIPAQELEKVYFRHSLVRKNVIFLIGKYYQNKFYELNHLAREYRIPLSRICTIPYNPRFQKAYENRQVLEYVKAEKNYQDVEFEANLKRTLDAVITYGSRKGEV